ncbi:MAG TPA: 16S rRNA (guanine(527)-N(7))-methyltransferase RsmG [Thermoleophilaceae bacterium]|nr:16S rRNA (guanine(527)-N(7))-methyltransferase RsmG [Thermoleophilaceae bacterium]
MQALAAEIDPPTTVTEPERAIHLHVADSLSALELEAVRDAEAIADVGAGAGFPGLPLAIALPHARIDLLEPARRKCAVIERLAAAAGIENARPVRARAEDWARGDGSEAYDLVTARAVASLAVLCEYGAPLLAREGTLVCWKGARDEDEERAGRAAAAGLGLRTADLRPAEPFPGVRNRHLHTFVKVGATPARFPRRTGIAAKRPLGSPSFARKDVLTDVPNTLDTWARSMPSPTRRVESERPRPP